MMKKLLDSDDRNPNMGDSEKCGYCEAKSEFICMVESNNPIYHHIEWVCSEHMKNIEKSIIDSWTKKEWLEME